MSKANLQANLFCKDALNESKVTAKAFIKCFYFKSVWLFNHQRILKQRYYCLHNITQNNSDKCLRSKSAYLNDFWRITWHRSTGVANGKISFASYEYIKCSYFYWICDQIKTLSIRDFLKIIHTSNFWTVLCIKKQTPNIKWLNAIFFLWTACNNLNNLQKPSPHSTDKYVLCVWLKCLSLGSSIHFFYYHVSVTLNIHRALVYSMVAKSSWLMIRKREIANGK